MTTDDHSPAELALTDAPLIDVGLLRELESSLFAGSPRPVTIARYELLRAIGAGGFGSVYLAHDPQLERDVAIKLLHRHGSSSARAELTALDASRESQLMREAKALARLSHVNVVQIYDAGAFDLEGQDFDARGGLITRGLFIVMEYVEGQNLAQWIAARPRRWPALLDKFRAAGRGLAAAHALGIIHRDFKPANVLVGVNGSVRVADFGLARAIEDSATASATTLAEVTAPAREERAPASALLRSSLLVTRGGSSVVAGTPRYMAPEQFLGHAVSPRTDQYAFCTALFEAMYGRHPIAGDTLAELSRNVTRGRVRVSPDDRVPAWLERILLRGLSREPGDRFPSMRALLDAIAAEGQLVAAERVALEPDAATRADARARDPLRALIRWLEPGLMILYEETERPSLRSVDVMREELTAKTAALPGYAMLVDVSRALMPGAEIREKIGEMFADPHLVYTVVVHGDDPVKKLTAELILEPVASGRYAIVSTRERAVALLRARLVDAGLPRS